MGMASIKPYTTIYEKNMVHCTTAQLTTIAILGKLSTVSKQASLITI